MSFIISRNGTKRCYWSCQGLSKALKRSEKKKKYERMMLEEEEYMLNLMKINTEQETLA